MIKIKFISLFILLISLLSYDAANASTNSALLTTATLSAIPNCVQYKVLGMCYWLSNSGVLNTTPYIQNYSPDVVVSVFDKAGTNAWAEINATIDQAGAIAEHQTISSLTEITVGDGQHSFSNNNEQNVFFKEAEVIGNPAITLLPTNLLLPSTSTPLKPYYQSMLDAPFWRGLPQVKTPLIEEGYAFIADIDHHVGTGLINWGGIYPHEGKVESSNDAKAAAVIAQRSADLITSSDFTHITGHIYQSLSNVCGQQCSASAIQENSSNTLFQLVYPITQTTCDYFGKTMSYGQDFETQTNGSYVWVVWRLYKGCINGNGKYLGKTLL